MQNSVQIIGNSIKSGITSRLSQIFPGVTLYRESITGTLLFPHFFVLQLSLDMKEDTYYYWWMNYLVNIRYRVAANTATVTNLNQQLDDVGLRLLSEFDKIRIWTNNGASQDGLYVLNPRYEKIDGVLQFFCEFSMMVNKSPEEYELQKELELNIDVIER